MPRLFALDHNFPDPIVAALRTFQADAELVRIDQIDPRMAELDDWELLLALHHHGRPWDGLITTDSSMLSQARELAALLQTKLTLVVAAESGHNPVRASGLLFAHLELICQRTTPGSHKHGPSVPTPERTTIPGSCSGAKPSTTTAQSRTCGANTAYAPTSSRTTRSRRSPHAPAEPRNPVEPPASRAGGPGGEWSARIEMRPNREAQFRISSD